MSQFAESFRQIEKLITEKQKLKRGEKHPRRDNERYLPIIVKIKNVILEKIKIVT
jgi:hypothetical protein